MKMLLTVDPQIDFIEGTLPVPGAVGAMNALAGYIRDNDGLYACKIVTADWHPFHHCSFSPEGGEWPRHCVADTVGAAIWAPLVDPLNITAGEAVTLHKGVRPDREEYSIFANEDASAAIRKIIDKYCITEIDICGIAGDICVLNTLKDGVGIYGTEMFRVLTRFSPSLDSGRALLDYITLNHIPCDR